MLTYLFVSPFIGKTLARNASQCGFSSYGIVKPKLLPMVIAKIVFGYIAKKSKG